jgi:very-short-patch-repair endonuclease
MRVAKANQYAVFLHLLQQLTNHWVPEYRYHPTRRWRFDFARPDIRLAIEVDGGIWTGGRHSRGKGMLADFEKNNCAVALGWQILHFTPSQVTKGDAYRFVHYLHHTKGGA